MRRAPVVPTILVALAVAVMIALGLWQLLDRRPKKLAFLAEIAANPGKPPVRFPIIPDDTLLYRRSVLTCRSPVDVSLRGAGAAGFRAIARCAGGATVQLGTTRDPAARPVWSGGVVTGLIVHQPDDRPILAADSRPVPLMLAADRPLAGLSPNPPPNPDAIANNHLAYAVQWFFFAAVALVFYALALRRRAVAPAPTRR